MNADMSSSFRRGNRGLKSAEDVMKKKEITNIDGVVTQALPNTMFRVELVDGRIILTTLTGRLRRNFIRIFPGDKVKVEMTPYDEERGRIVFKY